jgi:hypothetical protein
MSDEIRGWADEVLTQISDLVESGWLKTQPKGFAELHDQFDANTGWGDLIDELPWDQWAEVTRLVDEDLRKGA